MKTFAFLIAVFAFSVCAHAQTAFDQWDKNKDGKLIRSELPRALQSNFDKVDTDKDGFISRAEDKVFRERAGRGKRTNPNSGVNPNAKIIRDIDYTGTKNPRHTLDLYIPKDIAKDETLPLVIWVHGGGWQKGSKSNARHLLPIMKEGKYIGASINYRLTDEAQWPAQIHDCKAAIRWLRANAKEHHIDSSKIGVWGSSAGGHLVAMIGVSQKVKGLEGTLGNHTDQSSAVNCVANYYGPADMLTMNENPVGTMDHFAPGAPETKLLGGIPTNVVKRAQNASPITHVSKDDAPMLLVHGTVDPLVAHRQSVILEKALEKAGASATLVTVKGGGHGKGFGPKTTGIVHQFLGHHLRGEGTAPKDQTIPAQ